MQIIKPHWLSVKSLQNLNKKMNDIIEQDTVCPYCGESISILIDCSVEQQSYIEDCQVCCRPISLSVSCDENDEVTLVVRHEDE